MTRSVEILAADLDHAMEARPDLTMQEIVEEALARGLERTRWLHEDGNGDVPRNDRRADLAVAVAELAEYRGSLVSARSRLTDASKGERQGYEEGLVLERDTIPPLKLEASRLRAELRQAEADAAAGGVDLAAIEPQIDWRQTISVEGYTPPRFESNEDRRAATVAFFRRIRP